MVDSAKFGQKHLCPTCGCKFYDMNRTPPICPRCRTNLDDIDAGPVAIEAAEPDEIDVAEAIETPADAGDTED